MNPGIRYLIAMIPTLIGRRLRRQIRGVRAVLLLLVLGLVIGPQAYRAWTVGGPSPVAFASVHTWAPVVLTLMVLVTLSSGAAFAFRQQEVDFLFPAPVTRREILLYKVITTLTGGLLAALWTALFVFRFAPHWPFGIAGTVLAVWFVQLVGLLAGVAAAAADVRLTRWLRILLWSVVGLGAAIGLAVVRYLVPRDAGMQDALGELVHTWPVQALTWPVRVYVEAFLARTLPEFALWAGIGGALLGALFFVLVRLDVAWTEGSVRQSQILIQRLRRAASEGVIGASGGRLSGLRLPMLPRWGGFGPIVWRQSTEALRNLRAVLTTLVTFVAIPAVIVALAGHGEHGSLPAIVPLLAITVLSPHMFAFDFRRDLDRMAMLKALPLPALAVAAGQVAVPSLLRTLLQVLVLWGVVLLTHEISGNALIALVPALLTINWMAGALDNTLFLLWPHRIVHKGGEPMMSHRALSGSLLKMVILMPVVGLCGGAGYWVMQATGNPVLAGATLAAMALLFAVLFTFWLASCFRRYDVAALSES